MRLIVLLMSAAFVVGSGWSSVSAQAAEDPATAPAPNVPLPGVGSPFDDEDAIQPRFAEAVPMVQVLRAVRDQDLKRFRGAFTKKVAAGIKTEADWAKGLTYYTQRIAGFCGRQQDLADITFVFDPDPQAEDESAGQLTVVFRGRRRFEVRVVLENFAWKIDEK